MRTNRSVEHIAIFVPSLRGGGAERVMLNLANSLAQRGYRVDLVVAQAEGPYLSMVDTEVTLIDLSASRVAWALLPLRRYLREQCPDTMLSALSHANLIAIFARKLANVPTKLAISERSALPERPAGIKGRAMRFLMKQFYPEADNIICVSEGIERELRGYLAGSDEKILTIHNPVDFDLIDAQRNASVPHHWLQSRKHLIILTAGRLVKAKDFATLLKAFAMIHKSCEAKLIVMGQGPEETNLRALASKLGVSHEVDFVGFQDNPFAWMAQCDLFVLSSIREGFPNALIQAMACGARVVSTDCRTGPDEILESGRWGMLAPVGDATVLSEVMLASLSESNPPNTRSRAKDFKSDKIIDRYESVLLKAVCRKEK
ncbi:glycosyl transferase [Qipengyuania flava]|nr:glycosyl transferase [Qipengyuania flava]